MRTRPTVVSTQIAIATGASSYPARSLKLDHELELAKASLLYADSVELLSPIATMVQDFQELASGSPTDILRFFDRLKDDSLRSYEVTGDTSQFRSAIIEMRKFGHDNPDLIKGAEMFAEKGNEIGHESGWDELELPRHQGILRLNKGLISGGDDIDVTTKSFIDELIRYLNDPRVLLLADSQVNALVEEMAAQGRVNPSQRTVSNASEATIGTGLVARLPTFPGMSIEQIMELREELSEPLVQYRKAANRLRAYLQTGPFDRNIQAEVDALWRTEVDPELNNMRAAMADTKLIQESYRFSLQKIDRLVHGAFCTGLTIFFTQHTALDSVLKFLLPTSVAVASILGPAISKQKGARKEVELNDMYYLYKLDQRNQGFKG